MTLVIAQPKVIVEDPHACTDQADVLTIFRAIFDTLVQRTADGRWQPAAAKSWQVSPDARTFTFELRTDLVFHDGSRLDAEAVAFSLRRMARPDMGATLGAGGVYAHYLQGMSIDCLSPSSLRVTLATPLADFFDILAYGHIVSPPAIERAGDDTSARLIGSGPFRISHIEPGRWIDAEAVPHPLATARLPSHVRWQSVPEAADRAALLTDGRAAIATPLSSQDAATWRERDNGIVHAQVNPMAVVFLFNCATGPLTDRRVRRALNLAIDRQALIDEVLGGLGQPLHGFVSPKHFGAPSEAVAAAAMPFDVREASRLLAEAGHQNGLALAVDRPERLPDEAAALTAAVTRQLAEIGVTLDVRIEPDRVRYANRVRTKDIGDMALFDSSPLSTFRVLVEKIDSRERGSWWQGYANSTVEALLDEARSTVSHEARAELYQRIYALLQQDPPWLYLYTHRRMTGMAKAALGWRDSNDGILDVRGLTSGQG